MLVFVWFVRLIMTINQECATRLQRAWPVIKLMPAVYELLDRTDHDRLPPVAISDNVGMKLKQVRWR